MLEIDKMVQDDCVKSTRGATIPLEGKRKGVLWKLNPMFPSVNLRTHPKFSM